MPSTSKAWLDPQHQERRKGEREGKERDGKRRRKGGSEKGRERGDGRGGDGGEGFGDEGEVEEMLGRFQGTSGEAGRTAWGWVGDTIESPFLRSDWQ